MFIGHFTEQPWQDYKTGLMGGQGAADLGVSNSLYDSETGAQLYNRYIDEKQYAEEVGFDGLMLNEHHSTPFCMQGVTNVGAAILARVTKKAKIIILGNILPLWDDPMWLAEQLAMIDMISYGRLVPGFVRGGGREAFSHNAPPHYNWERFQEAHDLIIKAWTAPGPWRWEGKHYNYRYVNPWCMPYQKPHPPIWIPGVASEETVRWTARHGYPYIMLATEMEPTKQTFELYHATAREQGFKSGPQNIGYLFKVHVDETDEMADQVARKYILGVSNPFITGNEGVVRPWLMNPPGLTSRESIKRRNQLFGRSAPAGRGGVLAGGRSYEAQVANYGIITGTPDTVIAKVRYVLEYLRPGHIFFWDGDGSMTHEDQMRSLRLMGKYVIPAAREIGHELGLVSSYDVSPITGEPLKHGDPVPLAINRNVGVPVTAGG